MNNWKRGKQNGSSTGQNLPRSTDVIRGTLGNSLMLLLFLVYIKDISVDLSPGTEIRLLADDSMLYRTIKSPEDSQTLQKDLDILKLWGTASKMKVPPGRR